MVNVRFICPYGSDHIMETGNEQNIFFACSIDDWVQHPMVLSMDDRNLDFEWKFNINLPPGTHEYKYIVDGVWRHDASESSVDNIYGTYNNVVTIKEEEIDITTEKLVMWGKLIDPFGKIKYTS